MFPEEVKAEGVRLDFSNLTLDRDRLEYFYRIFQAPYILVRFSDKSILSTSIIIVLKIPEKYSKVLIGIFKTRCIGKKYILLLLLFTNQNSKIKKKIFAFCFLCCVFSLVSPLVQSKTVFPASISTNLECTSIQHSHKSSFLNFPKSPLWWAYQFKIAKELQ